MYLICYGCTFVDGPKSFRIAWGVQGIPGFILFAALFFFPESPRWLAGQERWEECLKTLALLHSNGDEYDPRVQAEYEEVKEAVRIAAESAELSVLGLFGRKMWWRTMCGMTVQMWQQLLGGNVAMYYIVYVFRMAGLDNNVVLWSAIIQYVIFLVTTGIILPFIDRFGRRQLLMGGAILCCILHFIIAALMASYGNEVDALGGNENLTWSMANGPTSASYGVIACSYIFVGVYGFTWAPIGWIYSSEVFPLKWRAKGVGLSAATNWIFNCKCLHESIANQSIRQLQKTNPLPPSRPCLLRRPSLHKHPVENLHHFRHLLLRHDFPNLLHLPGNLRQDSRRNRPAVRRQGASLEEWRGQERLRRARQRS